MVRHISSYLRYISSYRDSISYGWMFQAGAALVPFDFASQLVSEGAGATDLLTFDSFGSSGVVGGKTGVAPYDFASDEQRREWTLLAVEGLLVAKTYTARRLRLDSALRMEALGRSWTIEDFGYDEGEITNVDL